MDIPSINMSKLQSKMKAVIAACAILGGMTLHAADLAGHYVLRGVMEMGSELTLKPDGTFEFMMAYGAADYWAKGAWHRDGDSLVLETAGKPEKPFRPLRTEAGKPGQINVWVIGKNSKGVDNITVTLFTADRKHYQATTTSEGKAVLPDVAGANAVSFQIPVYSIEAGPFTIDPAKKDNYFEINGDAITEVFFDNERVAIDVKGGLTIDHWGQPMHYEKE